LTANRLLVASRNRKKLAELRRVLDAAGITGLELLSLDDVPPYDEAPETGATFEENAVAKARDGFTVQKGGVEQQARKVDAFAAGVDLLPDDLGQTGYDRVGLKAGFLLDHRHGGADVVGGRRNAQGGKRREDVGGPAVPVLDARWQEAGHQRAAFAVAGIERGRRPGGSGRDGLRGSWGRNRCRKGARQLGRGRRGGRCGGAGARWQFGRRARFDGTGRGAAGHQAGRQPGKSGTRSGSADQGFCAVDLAEFSASAMRLRLRV